MPDKDGANASTEQFTADGLNSFTAPTGFYDGDDTVTATDAQVSALDGDITAAKIAKNTNIFGVKGSALVATGDAAAANVLTGTTFSNSSVVGVAGEMPDIGDQDFSPTTTPQTISAGYHDGNGTVAGAMAFT